MTARRVDSNQREIVAQLRKIGASVAITSSLGHGFPDLVCGMFGKNYLFELKDGNKPPSARKLTTDEQLFHEKWKGQISVITSLDDALLILNEKKGQSKN